MVVNLVQNAIDANKKSGQDRPDISGGIAEGKIGIRLHDNGPGFRRHLRK